MAADDASKKPNIVTPKDAQEMERRGALGRERLRCRECGAEVGTPHLASCSRA